jgi:hypothetical protein
MEWLDRMDVVDGVYRYRFTGLSHVNLTNSGMIYDSNNHPSGIT